MQPNAVLIVIGVGIGVCVPFIWREAVVDTPPAAVASSVANSEPPAPEPQAPEPPTPSSAESPAVTKVEKHPAYPKLVAAASKLVADMTQMRAIRRELYENVAIVPKMPAALQAQFWKTMSALDRLIDQGTLLERLARRAIDGEINQDVQQTFDLHAAQFQALLIQYEAESVKFQRMVRH
jgi:hypothetical protein